MDYIEATKEYIPDCEQEELDKAFFLSFAAENPDCLSRDNDTAHFTASAWVVTPERDRVLMVYHNIYNSWSWTGGHADGEADLAAVALREVQEETGVKSARLVTGEPMSLEILTVDGHMKKGKYVHSHLHLNLTYLMEADPRDELFVKPDENSGVRWFTLGDMFAAVSEPWMAENVYKKLCRKIGWEV